MEKGRIIKIILKIFFAAFLVFIGATLIVNSVIPGKIRKELASLSPVIRIGFSSVHASIFSSSVSFDSLVILFMPYNNLPQHKHLLHFQRASLKGVSILKYLFNKKLVADNFLLEEGHFQLNQFLLDKQDSAQSEIFKKIQWPFKKLSIKNVELKRMAAFSNSNQGNQLMAKGDLAIGEVQMNIQDPVFLSFATIDCNLSNLNYSLPHTKDSLHIQKLVMDSHNESLQIDSLHLDSSNEAVIPAISVSGFDIKGFLSSHVLVIKKIKIDEGRIGVIGKGKSLKEQSLPFDLEKVHVGAFQFSNASISYKDPANELRVKGSVHLNEIDIKSLTKDGFHIGTVLCRLSDIHYAGKNAHNVEIKAMELDSKNEIMQIADLRVVPRYGKFEFERKLGHQADRVEASIPKVEIIKLQLEKLFHNKLYAEKIKIGNSKAHIFRDRRFPRLQKVSPLPIAFMKEIPLDMRVDTCELASSTVEYEEYPRAGYGQTGILRLERVGVILSPLINHPIASDPAYIIMKMNGSVMGSGTASATIKMPFENKKPYLLQGIFENLELTKLNSSSENLGRIRIKSGFLDFLFFDFTMTEERATGKIIGAYHHLIIQQLKKFKSEKNVADVTSFMLRHLIIPLNKDKTLPEKKRTGKVNYLRDPTRFVSFYFIQSLLMGVKKSFTLGFLLPK